jgi:hypothetical protein
MKYIKSFENKLPFKTPIGLEFSKLKEESYKSFSIIDIIRECKEFEINSNDLIREILLNNTIAFQCWGCWILDNDKVFKYEYRTTHSVLGKCIDIEFFNPEDEDAADEDKIFENVMCKIENTENWHDVPRTNKFRVYNYEEGKVAKELEMKKTANKYNL